MNEDMSFEMKALIIDMHASTCFAKYLFSLNVHEDVSFTCIFYPDDFEKVKLNKSVFHTALVLKIIRQKQSQMLKLIGWVKRKY